MGERTEQESKGENCKRLLNICKRLLEKSLEDQEDEWSRHRKYLLSEDCEFTLYREADLLIKEFENEVNTNK